jgi:carbon-monoxide dehydrogenase medium subunit
VKPCKFRYHRPASLDEALELLQGLGEEATPLAGGQSLVPMMNLRLAQPPNVVDLNRIPDLAYIRRENGELAIGAMTRARAAEASEEISGSLPLVAQALPHIAYPAIRRRGTIGGSVAHADPAAELVTTLLAADAEVVLARAGGRRQLTLAQFALGPYTTAREPDELLVEIRAPVNSAGTVAAFREVARKTGDFALVAVAALLDIAGGRCTRACVAVGGAGPVPIRLEAVEQSLAGAELDPTTLSAVGELAADSVEARGDAHGSADYRRRLVAVEVRRAVEQCAIEGGLRNGSR